jgi:hypothetical protein
MQKLAMQAALKPEKPPVVARPNRKPGLLG